MTTVPITIVDDFFDNPDDIRDWGLSLPFGPIDQRYPGVRTDEVANIHQPFYNFVNNKVNNLFFSSKFLGKEINIASKLFFQKIDNFEGEGWVHQDFAFYTFIVYLTPETDINCGTSLYKLKSPDFYPFRTPQDYNVENLRFNHHKTGKISNSEMKLKKEYRDNRFDKTLDIKDKYNRLIVFPSQIHHSANYLSNNESARLTLIGFVEFLAADEPTPIDRSKKTLMI